MVPRRKMKNGLQVSVSAEQKTNERFNLKEFQCINVENESHSQTLEIFIPSEETASVTVIHQQLICRRQGITLGVLEKLCRAEKPS